MSTEFQRIWHFGNEVGKHLITLNWCRKIFTRLLFWTVLEFAFSYNKYYIWKNKNKEFLVHDIQNLPVLEYTARNSSAYPEISPTLVYAFLIRNSKWMRKFLIKKILEIFLTLVYNSCQRWLWNTMHEALPARKVKNILLLQQNDHHSQDTKEHSDGCSIVWCS